jgi:PAS domain S-box-containing protein
MAEARLPDLLARARRLFAYAPLRYLFGLAAMGVAFGLRLLLSPWTGRGAPFVLFFGATLLTCLFSGVGPGLMVLLVSLPIAAVSFAVPGGATTKQAAFQVLLYGLDGLAIIYLTRLMQVSQARLEGANRDLGQAAENFRAAEARTRDIIELSPDAYFQATLKGRLIDVNQAACRSLGYPRDELLGKSVLDVVSEEEAQRLETVRIALMAPGRVDMSEWTQVRKDGTTLAVEASANILPDGRWQAFVRDISDRKRAEEALRFSEAKFSGIVSISADAIICVDEGEKITVFNTGAEKIFGYRRDEVLGAPLELLIPSSAAEGHRHDLSRFADGDGDGGQSRTGDHLASIDARRKSGEEFPAEASISSLQVGGTRVLTIVLRDVTEREQLEREQAILADVGVAMAATLDYEQTLATIAEIMVRDYADWCMVEVMEGADGMRRLKVVSADPAKAAIAERLEKVQLDRERPHLTRTVLVSRQPLLVTRLTEAQLQSFAQGDDHLRILRALEPASLMSVPLMVHDRLMGTLTFVSSRPSRLFGARDLRLGRALAERASLAIENARLYRAALQATGLRDHVLGFVAHDLRNPLSTILLHAAALQRKQPEGERRNPRHREVIERAARRMSHLIQDLLDVAVLEAGQLKVDRSPLAPREVVAEAIEMQQALAATASIELRVEAAPDAPEILGDRDRLLQVFENLIGNALKFTEAGGLVTVGAAPAESGSLFWVSDTGRGMTRDEQAHVFERFWQASARSGRLGAGLGLPITKGIIEAHGGRIWVESVPGQGSTFFFTIPAGAPADAHAGTVLH